MHTTIAVSAADLRAALARSHRHLYQVAAEVRLHPSHLSAMLNERVPLNADVARRLLRVLGQAAD